MGSPKGAAQHPEAHCTPLGSQGELVPRPWFLQLKLLREWRGSPSMRHGECLAPTRSARFTPHASRLTLYVSLFLLLLLAACAPASIELVAPDGAITQLDRRVLKEASLLYGGDEGVPLEYPLYAAGYRVIETLVVTGADGSITRYDWPAAAEGSRWLGRGQV